MQSFIPGQTAGAIAPAAPYLTATDYYRASLLPYQQQELEAKTQGQNLVNEDRASANETNIWKRSVDLTKMKKMKSEMDMFGEMEKNGESGPDNAVGTPPIGAPATIQPYNPSNTPEQLDGSGYSPPPPSVAAAIAPSQSAPSASIAGDPVEVATADEARALPPGTRYKRPDGVIRIRK